MTDRGRRFVIGLLKIALPLAALGVFASLFLFSSARFGGGISFDGVDVSALEEGLRITNPRFTGATDKGEPFVVTADWALPDGPRPERVELSAVVGEITLADGRRVTLSAAAGVLEPKAKVLTITEGAVLASSDGYEVTADSARLDVAAEALTASGMVVATGPLGRITADEMRAHRAVPAAARGDAEDAAAGGDDDGGPKEAYIWFEKRVKVRIDSARMARAPG